MYEVFVYDDKHCLVDKFMVKTYSKAMTMLAGDYGYSPKYEIRKIS